jgi:hypothetical protein
LAVMLWILNFVSYRAKFLVLQNKLREEDISVPNLLSIILTFCWPCISV